MKKNVLKKLLPVFFLIQGSLFAQETMGLERYGLFIGSNTGGKGTDRLLYAGKDALSLKQTMTKIGGISEKNSYLLLEPSKKEIDYAIEEISNAIMNNGSNTRSEFVFYYSGHSDENSLMLGKSNYSYSELKETINKVPSDVHVVILDSCYSGNFIRTKGGKKTSPFLTSNISDVKGFAYLASSSSKEFSQESDEIASSFFTNALLTGLKGAADSTGDNKVSLNELYTYAFNETLAKTEKSAVGPQHPNYDITLVGSGDLILSDISKSDCVIEFSKDIKGRIIIRDNYGRLVFEFTKVSGSDVSVASNEGVYSILLIEDEGSYEGEIVVSEGSTYVVSKEMLGRISTIKDSALKGSDIRFSEDSDEKTLKHRPFHFDFLPYYDNEYARGISTNVSIGLIGICDLKVEGAQLSFIRNEVLESMEGIQSSFIFNKTKKLEGIQFSSIENFAEKVNGVQFSGIRNESFEILDGIQFSGIQNKTRTLNGIQFGGIQNITLEEGKGVQFGGIQNKVSGFYGIQFAGIQNITENNIFGIQFAGICNSADFVQGIQFAGISNAAGEIKGLQSGLVNVSRDVKGLQCGLINVSKKINRGAQIGLINVSEDNEYFVLGLINIIKGGILEFGARYDSNLDLNLFFKSGNKNLYTTIEYSGSPANVFFGSYKNNEFMTYLSCGIGHRFHFAGIKSSYLDLEILHSSIFCEESRDYSRDVILNKIDHKDYEVKDFGFESLRLSYNFALFKHLAFIAGAKLDFGFGSLQKDYLNLINSSMNFDLDYFSVLPSFSFGFVIK